MVLFLLTTLVIGAAMLVMAVGVLLSNRCLRGSCGGPELLSADGESLLCETCPNRDKLPSIESST
ncbi:MAG: hypothetical protein CL480_06285 [Acidobacteria bacterium]|nr:hypothetical protein [Acidobacteriota bacterium]